MKRDLFQCKELYFDLFRHRSEEEIKIKVVKTVKKLHQNDNLVDNLRITYIYVHLIYAESKYLKYRRPQLQKEGVKTRHLSYIG